MGVPTAMIYTLADGKVAAFVGAKDITMIPSAVDISGLDVISQRVIVHAVQPVAATLQAQIPHAGDRPLVAASMFSDNMQCVKAARTRLEFSRFEILVFHATETGGQTMVNLVTAGYVSAVRDVTTT